MATTVTQPVEPEKDEATGKFVYNYQPRDSDGQFIGKPYRFLYTDHQDLVQQLTEAKEHGDRYIHEVKSGKRQVHGEAAQPQPDFKPIAAATEEDKTRREQARRDLEAELGAPIDAVRDRLKRAGELDEYLLAQQWASENEANGFFICPANGRMMMAYLDGENPEGKKYARTRANLDLAFEALKEKLTPKPQEQAPPADSTQQPPPTQAARPQSTGIIPGQFAGTRPAARTGKQPLTAERFSQINKMSRDDFNKLKRTNEKEYWAFVEMKKPAQPQQ